MLTPAGSVIVDAGAHLVLSRRDSGGRLLPAGVVGVQGVFASGQAVRVVVKRRKNVVEAEAAAAGTAEANGYVNVPSANSLLLHESTNSFGNGSPTVMTQPGTPRLLPVASMTSSISTLETLPSVETSPVETRHASGFSHHAGKGAGTDDEWELVEVGRGLAVYNSVQIESVKGLKRCVALRS
jgi:glutamate 5-kinase